MSQTKKKRIRSVILATAVSATACGGQVIGDVVPPEEGDGDGDYILGDHVVGDYAVGQPPQLVGTGGSPVVDPGSFGTGGSVGDLVVGVPPWGGAGPTGMGGEGSDSE